MQGMSAIICAYYELPERQFEFELIIRADKGMGHYQDTNVQENYIHNTFLDVF